MSDQPARTYVFGSREQVGLFGSMRKGQAVILGIAVVVVLMTFYRLSNTLGLMLATGEFVAALAITMYPINGRTADQWLPVWINWLLRRSEAEQGYRSRIVGAGAVAKAGELPPELAACLPPQLVDLELLTVPYGPEGHPVGVVFDRKYSSYTAVVKMKAQAFGFQDDAEQQRALESWGMALAASAQDGAAVRRVQWIERTLPKGSDDLASYLERELDQTIDIETNSAVRSYIRNVSKAGPTAQEHEILLAVQTDASLAARQIKRAGGDEQMGATKALFDEIETFVSNIERGSVTAVGMLTARQYAAAIRDGFDPYGREQRTAAAARAGEGEGISPARMGPLAAEARWDHYRSDGAVHITYWVSGWPRVAVHASFMMPLLMQTQVNRAISVVMAPVPFSVAVRKAEAQQTAEDADEIDRQDKGFSTTAKIRRRKEAATRKDEELAAGHGEMRFAGFMTISGESVEHAEDNALQLEREALRVGLELQRMDGEQDQAFAFGLPICRGLAG